MQKILIVDDDPAGTQLLMTLLGLEGYQPCSLQNWRDPVSDVALHRPDLVIMDIYLRTKDGFEILGELRGHPDPAVARTPVLMMSAEDHRVRCRQEGANGFLEKPFRLGELIGAIREIKEASISNS